MVHPHIAIKLVGVEYNGLPFSNIMERIKSPKYVKGMNIATFSKASGIMVSGRRTPLKINKGAENPPNKPPANSTDLRIPPKIKPRDNIIAIPKRDTANRTGKS